MASWPQSPGHEHRFTYIVIIAVRTVFIFLFVLRHVLAECPAAVFTQERQLHRLDQWMRLCLCMTLWTLHQHIQYTYIKELATAGCANRDLSIQNMFTGGMSQRVQRTTSAESHAENAKTHARVALARRICHKTRKKTYWVNTETSRSWPYFLVCLGRGGSSPPCRTVRPRMNYTL